MDYDRKKSKFRSDRIETKSSHSSSSSKHKHRDDSPDDYHSSYKRSKSRSRSRSHSRSRESSSYSSRSHAFSNNESDHYKYDESYNNSVNFNKLHHQYQQQQLQARQQQNMGQPSRTIMLRQLPIQMDDGEIRNELNLLTVPYKDMRLVRHRDTGVSRGFAFVEFNSIDEARQWMHSTQGWITFRNYESRVQLFYSNSNGDESNSLSNNSRRFGSNLGAQSNEWDCMKCGLRNFKRRDRCFKCSMTREESEKRMGGEGFEHVGSTPCNTLIIRGLDALTVEDAVKNTLNATSNSTLPIKNCHIARDSFTKVSMGFCFVEMTSIQDAGYMIQLLQPYFEIEGKQVVANYAKNTFKTALNQIESQHDNSTNQSSYNGNSYTHQNTINNKLNQGDQANSAAAVAQKALSLMHKKQEILSQFTCSLKQQTPPTFTTLTNQIDQIIPPAVDLDNTIGANLKFLAKQVDPANKIYNPPDVSSFTYDETSGYYYDYSTGFYYDAASQYYYNSLTQSYMYWDSIKSTYIPVSSSGTGTDASNISDINKSAFETNKTSLTNQTEIETSSEKTSSTKNEAKPAKPPVAKTAAQIAKDMESWAKSMNKKKDAKKPTIAPVTSITSSVQPSGFVEVKSQGFAPIEKTEQIIEPERPIKNEADDTSASTSNYKTNNENEKEAENEEIAMNKTKQDEPNFIDLAKMACLLCKRRFESVEILNKHISKSDLHKTNLEKFKQEEEQEKIPIKEEDATSTSQMSSEELKAKKESDSLLAALQYRDRAKERRKQFGSPEPPSPTYSSSKTKPSSNQSNDVSYIEKNTESVASKLMKKMGWNEGSGIGKNLQGISAPIEATMRQKGAGLGSATYEMDPNDSYRDAVRKSARARYEQLS